MTDWRPQRKVAGAGISGAIVMVLVWIGGQTGVEIPAEVAAALVTIVAFITAYMIPQGIDRQPRPEPEQPDDAEAIA